LVTLDTTNPGLSNDLEVLDTITARDNDTVHVFYVKSGQRLAQDILRNVVSFSVNQRRRYCVYNDDGYFLLLEIFCDFIYELY
jgi:hypothetical protein